jgi:hypothetical protein
MYSTGLFDRAWGKYRQAIETSWQPYVEGSIDLDQAVSRMIDKIDPHW